MIISNYIKMRCTLCGKEHKIKRRLFCYHSADQIFEVSQMWHVWRKHRTYIDSKVKFIIRLAMEMLLYVVLQIWDIVTGVLWLALTPLDKLYEILRLR